MEHPFAPYIRTLGRGKRGMRDLTIDEAHSAFGMILRGEIEPVQLGAFLMLLRVKEENGAELAGMVRAAREAIALPATLPRVDLDWSSYAGKRRQLPWFLLAALLLVENDVTVFMHGLRGRNDNRLYTPAALESLGIAECATLDDAAAALRERRFAFVALENFAPRLAELIGLRDVLGLRSPVNSLARMLNPFNAPYLLQGIFHPGYRAIHRDAALALGQAHMAVIKGEGGEIERNPDVETEVYTVHNGSDSIETWPAWFSARHVKDDTMDLTRLGALWRGDLDDEYGTAAVISTAAVALKLLGRAASIETAQAAAKQFWAQRNRQRLA